VRAAGLTDEGAGADVARRCRQQRRSRWCVTHDSSQSLRDAKHKRRGRVYMRGVEAWLAPDKGRGGLVLTIGLSRPAHSERSNESAHEGPIPRLRRSRAVVAARRKRTRFASLARRSF
jgi:hypothetical protein